jgi:hypothetical protein
MPRTAWLPFDEAAERQKRIAEMYASGVPSEAVGPLFGVSGRWVREIAHRYEVARGNRGHHRSRRDRWGRFV